MRFLAFALLFATSCGRAQEYSLGPDSQPHDGVPKGTVTKYQLAPGKFYPGTPHTYWVYVPAQYDASKPTPFMIYHGWQRRGRQQPARAGGVRQSDRKATNCRR